jgi:hypothetical protein
VEAIKSGVRRDEVGTGTSSVVSGTGFLYFISSGLKEEKRKDKLLVGLGMLIALQYRLYLCR